MIGLLQFPVWLDHGLFPSWIVRFAGTRNISHEARNCKAQKISSSSPVLLGRLERLTRKSQAPPTSSYPVSFSPTASFNSLLHLVSQASFAVATTSDKSEALRALCQNGTWFSGGVSHSASIPKRPDQNWLSILTVHKSIASARTLHP